MNSFESSSIPSDSSISSEPIESPNTTNTTTTTNTDTDITAAITATNYNKPTGIIQNTICSSLHWSRYYQTHLREPNCTNELSPWLLKKIEGKKIINSLNFYISLQITFLRQIFYHITNNNNNNSKNIQFEVNESTMNNDKYSR